MAHHKSTLSINMHFMPFFLSSSKENLQAWHNRWVRLVTEPRLIRFTLLSSFFFQFLVHQLYVFDSEGWEVVVCCCNCGGFEFNFWFSFWFQKVEGAKNDGEKKAGDAGQKKDDGVVTAVFKIDMHCDGCAKKVKRAVKHLDGKYPLTSRLLSFS